MISGVVRYGKQVPVLAGPWTVANLKPAGVWIRERMLSPADDFPAVLLHLPVNLW